MRGLLPLSHCFAWLHGRVARAKHLDAFRDRALILLERAQIVVNLAGHNLGVAAKLDKALLGPARIQ